MNKNLVRDWMTTNPLTVNSNVTIPEAYWMMVNNKIRRLLVVDDEKSMCEFLEIMLKKDES